MRTDRHITRPIRRGRDTSQRRAAAGGARRLEASESAARPANHGMAGVGWFVLGGILARESMGGHGGAWTGARGRARAGGSSAAHVEQTGDGLRGMRLGAQMSGRTRMRFRA